MSAYVQAVRPPLCSFLPLADAANQIGHARERKRRDLGIALAEFVESGVL